MSGLPVALSSCSWSGIEGLLPPPGQHELTEVGKGTWWGGTAESRNLGCSLQNERQRKHFDLDRDLLATGNYNVVMLWCDI